MATSQLIQDLTTIPNIIGGLGLAIADAQKAFDVEYLDSIERLMAIAKSLFPDSASAPGRTSAASPPAGAPTTLDAFFMQLLKACAPPRYMYTQTTLDVRMDLAQSLNAGGTIGFGAGYGGITVNGSVSIAYGMNYEAAAEVKTIIQAIPPDPETLTTFLNSISSFSSSSLSYATTNSAEQMIMQKFGTIASNTGTVTSPPSSPPSAKKF